MATQNPSQEANRLHISKPGRWTDMRGTPVNLTQAELTASAAGYDPALHEAPLVIGHPQHDTPAYGWVQSLAFSEDEPEFPGLYAQLAKVNPDAADLVASGALGKVSARFYTPTAKANPKPGIYYLRDVGLLGAQPPAIKGLKPPQLVSFAEADASEVVEFSEWDDVTNSGLWRSLRDWFIGKFGQAEADKAIPSWDVKSLEQGAQQELADARAEGEASGPLAAFAEGSHAPASTPETAPGAAPAAADAPSAQPGQTPATPTLEDIVTPEEKAALEAENQKLRAELEQRRQAEVHADNVAFAEGLADKFPQPALRNMIVATLDHLALQPQVVEFGEGDGKQPLADGLKAALKAAPQVVAFGEQATHSAAATGRRNEPDPDDVAFAESDPDRLAQHKAIKAHATQHNLSYAEADLALRRR